MNKVTSEKENLLEGFEKLSTRIYSIHGQRVFTDTDIVSTQNSGYSSVYTFLSQSLDHIASVAHQEGREEAIEEIRDLVKPLADMEAVLKGLNKLTGKEEGKA